MAQIKTLVDKNGEQVLPRTRVEAITLSDGTTKLEDQLITLVDGLPSNPVIINASAIPILDLDNNFGADNVEDALAELVESKAPINNPTFIGMVTLPSTTSIGSVSNTEIGYLDGVESSIQTQINSKTSTGKAIAMAIVFGG